MKNIKAQVWVETVIYTLIAFVMIGAVLAFAKPKIEEFQDKAIIEQTVVALENMNYVILSIVQGGAGNKRIIELGIKKGIFNIDGINNKLIFEIESRFIYSEPGKDIEMGNIIAHTKEKGSFNLVTLTSNFPKYNITYQNKSELKLINKAPTPYRILISNYGKENGQTQIDFKIV